MSQTKDKRLGLLMDVAREDGDGTLKLIVEDAETAELGSMEQR